MANLDFFSTYTLRAIIDEITPEHFFFSSRYFPTGAGDVFKSDKVLTEYRKNNRRMAAFVSDRGGAVPVERQGFEMWEMSPAKIAVSRTLTVDDVNKRGFGEALYSNLTPAQRALKLQQQDLIDLNKLIVRREEWMCVQTMINNACTIQEYSDAKTIGGKKHVQFYENSSSEHKYTTANKWNSDKADIIGDVKAMCDLLAKRGLNAADLILGSDVADVFYSDPKIKELLDRNLAINFGTVNETIAYPGVSTLGTFNFRGYNLRIFVVNTSYEDDNGNDTQYFPKDAAMVTFPNCGHLMYGAITQMQYGGTTLETIAAKRVPKFFVDNEHDVRTISLATRPLAAPNTYCPYIFAETVIG